MHRLRSAALPLLFLWLPACSNGGVQNRPQSEVKIAANHHLFWLRTLPGFKNVTSRADAVATGLGVLALADDSTYSLTVPNGTGTTTATDRYALAKNAELSVFTTGSGRTPSTVLLGGYRLVGNQPDVFFTDRVSAGNSLGIGLFFGTVTIPLSFDLTANPPPADPLSGDWHVVSLHTALKPTAAITSRNVARALHGSLHIDDGVPGSTTTPRVINGSGRESDDAQPRLVPLTGTAGLVLDGPDTARTGDGSCALTLAYDGDTRAFQLDPTHPAAALGRDVLFALDGNEVANDSNPNDAFAGLLVLMRQFPTGASDPGASQDNMAGRYLVGGTTMFVNPSNPGSDAFVGFLTLTTLGGQRGFTLDAVGHQGIDFRYTGTFTLNQTNGKNDGGLTLTVTSTGETWFAAIGRNYDTLVLIDDQVEHLANRPNPELNLLVGFRVPPPQ